MPARRVLVVDDDPIILNIVTTVLDLEHFETETVDSGPSALERIEEDPPDVVVLDVMMPDMDGIEVLRTIRESEQAAELPVVLLTARDSSKDRQIGIDAGADAYLSKPFSPLELIEVIEKLLARRR